MTMASVKMKKVMASIKLRSGYDDNIAFDFLRRDLIPTLKTGSLKNMEPFRRIVPTRITPLPTLSRPNMPPLKPKKKKRSKTVFRPFTRLPKRKTQRKREIKVKTGYHTMYNTTNSPNKDGAIHMKYMRIDKPKKQLRVSFENNNMNRMQAMQMKQFKASADRIRNIQLQLKGASNNRNKNNEWGTPTGDEYNNDIGGRFIAMIDQKKQLNGSSENDNINRMHAMQMKQLQLSGNKIRKIQLQLKAVTNNHNVDGSPDVVTNNNSKARTNNYNVDGSPNVAMNNNSKAATNNIWQQKGTNIMGKSELQKLVPPGELKKVLSYPKWAYRVQGRKIVLKKDNETKLRLAQFKKK
jgi:hypothetical protein